MLENISISGLQGHDITDDRNILYLKVQYNDQVYDWAIYIPTDRVDYDQFIAENEETIYAQIDAKEAEWEAMESKVVTYGEGESSFSRELTKSEVVKFDIPDYYAKRRAEYPPVGQQLDAFWKGVNSPEYLAMLEKIQAVKRKYPKL